MDLNALQAFVEVARTGSFSAAAQTLFITQPAVSKRVASLETELDCRLFDRIGRTVTLSPAGRALLPRAQDLLNQAADLKRTVGSLSGEVKGTLVMGTSHHIGLHRLPPVLRTYTQRYPEVQLDIRFMDSEIACRAVEAGDLELAVVTLPTVPMPNLHTEVIWDDPLHFVVSPDHPLGVRESCPPEELVRHPAVLPSPATYTRGILERAFANLGLELQVSMSTNYLETVKMLVSTGLGWSLLPASMLADDQLHRLDLGIELHRVLGSAVHQGRALSNAGRVMLELCHAQREPA